MKSNILLTLKLVGLLMLSPLAQAQEAQEAAVFPYQPGSLLLPFGGGRNIRMTEEERIALYEHAKKHAEEVKVRVSQGMADYLAQHLALIAEYKAELETKRGIREKKVIADKIQKEYEEAITLLRRREQAGAAATGKADELELEWLLYCARMRSCKYTIELGLGQYAVQAKDCAKRVLEERAKRYQSGLASYDGVLVAQIVYSEIILNKELRKKEPITDAEVKKAQEAAQQLRELTEKRIQEGFAAPDVATRANIIIGTLMLEYRIALLIRHDKKEAERLAEEIRKQLQAFINELGDAPEHAALKSYLEILLRNFKWYHR